MCMHARMRRLVWSGDGTYVRRRRPWPARGKICACAFLVHVYTSYIVQAMHPKQSVILDEKTELPWVGTSHCVLGRIYQLSYQGSPDIHAHVTLWTSCSRYS